MSVLKAAHTLPSVQFGFLNNQVWTKQEGTKVEQACGAILIISLSMKPIFTMPFSKQEFNEILGVLKNIVILNITKIVDYFKNII